MEDVLTPIIFLVVGVGGIYIATQLMNKRKVLLQNGVETDGVVNGFETSFDFNNAAISYPVIRFQTKELKLIEAKASVAPPRFLLKDGQKVVVIYNPDDPTEFIFKTKFDFSKISYGILFFGIVFLLIGMWMTYKYLVS